MVQNRGARFWWRPIGRIREALLRNPGAEKSEVLDHLAEAVRRTGGEVIGLEADRVPSKTGAAAAFRYLSGFQLDRKASGR